MVCVAIGDTLSKGQELVWEGKARFDGGIWRVSDSGTKVRMRFFPVYPEYRLPIGRFACFIPYSGFTVDLQIGMLQARIKRPEIDGSYYEVIVEEIV